MKQTLSSLSAKFLELHKELLTYETKLVEAADGRRYAPMELWHLTTQDPRFAWLRALSSLIVEIDTAVSARDPSKAESPASLLRKAQDLFSAADSDFARNYQMALQANLPLRACDAEIRKMLEGENA